MKPIKNRIFAEILPEPELKSGIIILNNENLNKYRAKVLAIGPEVKHVKIGDVVRYNENQSIAYEENGKKFIFLNETNGDLNSDIIAIL